MHPRYDQSRLGIKFCKQPVATDQWTKKWKHTRNPLQTRLMCLISQNRAFHNTFEAKPQAIDAAYNFKAEGRFSANERRRWHRAERACDVGDPETTPTGFCEPSTLGKGIYTSGTSPKPYGYVKQIAPSRHPATLMCRMIAGKGKKLTQADHNLLVAPAGYDSVQGVRGRGLSYEEFIGYDTDQIRPL